MTPDYSHPTKTCDLVMKGGVTSGLVYPRAALQLAEEYSFKCIGGTSAGAVAAAFTAAAEYNRQGGGFQRLNDLNLELQKNDKLSSLFQPSNETRPALNLFLGAPEYRRQAAALSGQRLLGKIMGAVRLALKALEDIGVPGLAAGRTKGAIFGIVAAIVIAMIVLLAAWLLGADASLRTFAGAALVLGVLFGVLGWILGGLGRGLSTLYDIIVDKLPANHFGICNGLSPKGAPKEPEAVTEWMHRQIQRIAGKSESEPLTIGELRDKDIELKTVTTNLNLARPYVLPFPETQHPERDGADAAASAHLIFCERDLETLFPQDVVTHLVKKAYPRGGWQLPKDFHFLPAEDELPAVVAARMSMSFPLFFSSVPLYQLPRRMVEATSASGPLNKDDLIPNWFSDGGIASNFPIHFFDAWIPSRPTFGITLRYLPEEVAAGQDRSNTAARHYYDALGERGSRPAPAVTTPDSSSAPGKEAIKNVWLPQPGERVAPDWTPLREPHSTAPATLGDVWKFLWSVFETAQNYRDNMQAELPSYAERIVQVRLEPNEGGFNLKMPTKIITDVVGKGDKAGTLLRHEFNFEQHQWVRFRMLTEQLDDAFNRLLENEKTHAINLLALHQLQACATPPYPWPLPQPSSDASAQRVLLFSNFMKAWVDRKLSDLGPGDALARLRITPRI
ncbi:MAG: patatin-like phospholipase family protein [Burkholderiales bacterium]